MFKKPLSFKGRIRRTEYGISLIIPMVYYTVLQLVIPAIFMSPFVGKGYVRKDVLADARENMVLTYLLFAIPMIYFSYAQAAKRCHDMGKSGWYALIPFYPIYLMFGEGEVLDNQYGADPKKSKEIDQIVPPINLDDITFPSGTIEQQVFWDEHLRKRLGMSREQFSIFKWEENMRRQLKMSREQFEIFKKEEDMREQLKMSREQYEIYKSENNGQKTFTEPISPNNKEFTSDKLYSKNN